VVVVSLCDAAPPNARKNSKTISLIWWPDNCYLPLHEFNTAPAPGLCERFAQQKDKPVKISDYDSLDFDWKKELFRQWNCLCPLLTPEVAPTLFGKCRIQPK
jgi:hypothetical protein